MSLIPEPPEVYRYGARRRGGITVEPVWIRWQGTNVQVYTGNGGLVAEFNAWDLSPLSDPNHIGESEFQAVGDAYIESGNTALDYFDVLSYSETIEGDYSKPLTFLVDNNLFYVQSRMKESSVEGTYHHAYWHGGNPTATPPYSDAGHYGYDTKDFSGKTGAIADVLVVKINIEDGSVTATSQVCYTMEVDLNYVAWDKFNYDMNHSTSSVVGLLSSATGLSVEHFEASHSTGTNWVTNNSTWTEATTSTPTFESSKDKYYYMTGLPWKYDATTYFRVWSAPGVAITENLGGWQYPGVSYFMPVNRYYQTFAASVWEERIEAGTYQEYQKGEFFEVPRWSGIDTVNGVVSSTFDNIEDIGGSWYIYEECLVEVSSFNTQPGNSSLSGFAGIGHSEFSGAYANLLLDNESDVDHEIDSVAETLKAAIEGPLRSTKCSSSAHDYNGTGHELIDDRSDFYGYFANPQVWLEPMAETRPETSDPQYFWSNLEGAKFHMPNALNSVIEGEAVMHYKISV